MKWRHTFNKQSLSNVYFVLDVLNALSLWPQYIKISGKWPFLWGYFVLDVLNAFSLLPQCL